MKSRLVKPALPDQSLLIIRTGFLQKLFPAANGQVTNLVGDLSIFSWYPSWSNTALGDSHRKKHGFGFFDLSELMVKFIDGIGEFHVSEIKPAEKSIPEWNGFAKGAVSGTLGAPKRWSTTIRNYAQVYGKNGVSCMRGGFPNKSK